MPQQLSSEIPIDFTIRQYLSETRKYPLRDSPRELAMRKQCHHGNCNCPFKEWCWFQPNERISHGQETCQAKEKTGR